MEGFSKGGVAEPLSYLQIALITQRALSINLSSVPKGRRPMRQYAQSPEG